MQVITSERQNFEQRDTTVISEKFIGLQGSVSDFWRWALSDWQSAGTRAQLAEYYVRRALGLEKEQAPEWEYVDIHMQNGTKIEVKSASLIQPPKKELTRPSFDIKIREMVWINERQNTTSEIQQLAKKENAQWLQEKGGGWLISDPPKRWADCYVFCVENSTDLDAYNPLDISQWDFYVLATHKINERFKDQKTVSLNRFKQEGFTPVTFVALKAEIDKIICL